MITTKPRLFADVMQSLEGEKTVFLVGCAECATVCKTGIYDRLKDIERLKEFLACSVQVHDYSVTSALVLEVDSGIFW